MPVFIYGNRTGILLGFMSTRVKYPPGEIVRNRRGRPVSKGIHSTDMSFGAKPFWIAQVRNPVKPIEQYGYARMDHELGLFRLKIGVHDSSGPYADPGGGPLGAVFSRYIVQMVIPSWFLAVISLGSAALLWRQFHNHRRRHDARSNLRKAFGENV